MTAVEQAFSRISAAIDAGRPAHGYLVCGDLRGQCDALVALVLAKLFPGEPEKIANRCHPDVSYLEPEGKSRTIHVASMRDRIVAPMSVTSYSGGWKVGVVVGADRMETAAANAFLKTLEEPPPRTMFFMLTDAPDGVLPTIVSRSQRIDLEMSEGLVGDEAYDVVRDVFANPPKEGVMERSAAGRRLAEALASLKDETPDADVALARKSFFKTILHFVRGWMVDGKLPLYKAFRNVELVERAYRQSEKSINDEMVLCCMMDGMALP